MEIVAVVNRKGGVGKTATAQALGAGLRKRGHKVLFIDLDSQTNLTYSLGATSNNLTSMELLTETAKAEDCIMQLDQWDVIPASPSLAAADTIITGTGKEYKLLEALEPIKANYDYIIIDTPAQLGTLSVNALTCANSALIPVQADVFSLQGIGLLFETIEAVKKYCNKGLTIKGVLTTRYNSRAVISRDMQENLDKFARELNTTLFNTTIRECTAIKEAQALKQDIFTYAPKSNAATDYEAFIKEFLERN